MNDPRELIAVFQELNASDERNVAFFTPGLVGMFGSIALMNDFLDDLDQAFTKQSISASLKSRANNLTRTFIPQVAALNFIPDLASQEVSVETLRGINSDSCESRVQGVKTILASLTHILSKSCKIGDKS